MQRTNDSSEEAHSLLAALELHRLQSIRNILLVILLIQLVLIGIGATLVWQANRLTTASARFKPNPDATQGDFGIRPEELPRPPENQPIQVPFSATRSTPL